MRVINLEYYPKKHMMADVLTKAMVRDRREKLTKMMEFDDISHLQSRSV
jgi:hypothetical protein